MAFISRMISSKPNYGGNESWEFLAEQCRLATAKDVRSPHEELKKLVRLSFESVLPCVAGIPGRRPVFHVNQPITQALVRLRRTG